MLAANWRLLDVGRFADPEPLRNDWLRLPSRALIPAGLNTAEFLIPLFKHLQGAELATVRGDGELLMAMPVKRRRFPPSLLANWITPLSISGLPHIDRRFGAEALAAFLHHERSPVMITSVPADGPFWDTLVAAAPRLAILNQWERAALLPFGSFETWFEGNFERKRRKEYRRLRSRLSEQGRLQSLSLQRDDEVGAWAQGLLVLEAGGWKGKRGTAISSSVAVAAAFTEVAYDLHRAGKLRFWALVLDGRAIATMFAVVEGSRAWLGKMAYDEAFARFSPGVLLMLDATEALFKEAGLELVDSCAIPNHPMIDNIWRDRIAMADVLVASAETSQLRFELILLAERLRRAARSTARDVFNAVTGRHRL
jgi:CelD/BcsL family acetyltransferase involved in cellulose biosynthesis